MLTTTLPGGQPPIFVADAQRRYFGPGSRRGGPGRGSSLWSDQIETLMRGIAVFRVFAEPAVHAILTSVFDETAVFDLLTGDVSELRGARTK